MELDVMIIGGGAAGLSAAVVLGRSRRSVTVIDADAPRNAPAAGVHNFLTRDGIPPAELVATGRKEVEQYGGSVVDGTATGARRVAEGFEVTLDDGRRFTARRLLVTTGLTDELPDLPGVRELWGSYVLHCPYCHGWEVRDRPVGVLGTGPLAVHQTLLFRQLTDDLVLFTHTAPELTGEQAAQLAARGVRVVTGPVAALEAAEGRLTGVRMADGSFVPRHAVAVSPRFAANSRVLDGLGVTPAAHPNGLGEHVPAGPGGVTDVPGVWVAGNVTDPMAQVVSAAAAGVTAAAMMNADLADEDARAAVSAAS